MGAGGYMWEIKKKKNPENLRLELCLVFGESNLKYGGGEEGRGSQLKAHPRMKDHLYATNNFLNYMI